MVGKMKNNKTTVGFLGLTHLGVNTAVALASKGFSTVWFAEEQEQVNRLELGQLGVVEPDLDDFFSTYRDKINITADKADLKECDVVYISPDVSTNDEGLSDLSLINDLLASSIDHLASSAVLVVLSQVPPGFTRNISYPKNQLFYQVETLVFGQALSRALNPERYIIGANTSDASLPAHYLTLLESFNCPVLKMSYESAELAKIAINCYLVSSVSTTNTLVEISKGVGANWLEIVPALKLDRRIGEYAYLMPGLGISGGNLERDLATLNNIGSNFGSNINLISAWSDCSAYYKNWAYRVLFSELLSSSQSGFVAVLGLAYKAGTHSIKNSPSMLLLNSLTQVSVKVYDPVVDGRDEISGVEFANSALECCQGADAVVLMTPWAEFYNLPPEQLVGVMRGRLLIDPFAVLERDSCKDVGLKHITLTN